MLPGCADRGGGAFQAVPNELADVTPLPGPTARLELAPLTPSVQAGAPLQFTPRALDAHGNERPARPQWPRDDAAGSITSEGLFTAGSTPDEFPHAVTASLDGVSATTTVRVLAHDPDAGTCDGTDGGAQTPPPGTATPGGCGSTGPSDASLPLGALLLLGLGLTRRRLSPRNEALSRLEP